VLELSNGMTIAPPPAVIGHEIEMVLERCFPNRVVPEPFTLLGVGFAHAAADSNMNVPMQWPAGADAMPAAMRAAIEERLRAVAEHSLLSGVYLLGDRADIGPVTDLTIERHFKALLEQWRGAASQYSPDALEEEIYGSNFSDIDGLLRETLDRHGISLDEFAQRNKLRGRAFLEAMPFQKADIHLKKQWAKNASLRPKDSDLVDWAFLNVAVCYCDVVVTENQMTHLFSRGFDMRATVISKLSQLPELIG
jgi:hypothetical protein